MSIPKITWFYRQIWNYKASVRRLLSEEKKKEDLIDYVHAIFVVTHDEKFDNEITEIGICLW